MIGIDDAVTAVSNVVGKVIDHIAPDQTLNAQLKADLAKQVADNSLKEYLADSDLIKSQLAVDQAEASSGNSFAADARPMVMYGMLAIMMWGLMLLPILSYLFKVWHPELPPLPSLDISMAANIVLGMLGLGGMHTYEKIKGQ